MKKKVYLIAVLLLGSILMSGCWDYRGLDTLDIVTGFAVDKDFETGQYLITVEIVDIKSGEEDLSTVYIECAGETLFDAIRNSKKRLINRLYGGNMQSLIISRQIAEREGINDIIEMMLRDGEPRETLSVAISKEETAREILLTKGLDSKIIGFEIHEMIIEDNAATASTKDLPLYKVYEATRGEGDSLVLPAIRCIPNLEDETAEADGIALFRGDRLIGFDTPENTMDYLFIMNEIKGGVISFPAYEAGEVVTMEINKSNTKTNIKMQDGVFHISVDIKTNVDLTEIKSQVDVAESVQRNEFETMIGTVLEERIKTYMQHVQTMYGTDIFGLGNKVYQNDPDLWRSVKHEWDIWFQNATVEVRVDASILTAGMLKNY